MNGEPETGHAPTARPDRLTLAISLVCVTGVLGGALWIYSSMKEAADRAQCRGYFKQLAFALHNYHEDYGSFPPAFVLGPDGERWHSWRVLLLPYVGREELYRKYHFDEPWNGPRNLRLRDEIPSVYACPATGDASRGITNYLAVVGRATPWPEQYATSLEHFVDGVSNTILLVESGDSDILWLEPRDLTPPQVMRRPDPNPRPSFSSPHDGMAHVAIADGAARAISEHIDRMTLASLLSVNRGRPLPGVDWPPEPIPALVELPRPTPAREFVRTDVLPHTAEQIRAGRNYVYCCTFELAWQQLKDQIGGPVRLEGDPPLAGRLNETSFRRDDVSQGALVARAGRGSEGIAEQIRDEIRRKFPSAEPRLPQRLEKSAVFLYAYLQKNLPFAVSFDALPEPLAFHSANGPVRVESFGVRDFKNEVARDERLREQVDVLDYVSDTDFVLGLKSSLAKDEIVLAKVQPEATLAETINAVRRRIESPDANHHWPKLETGDTLVVPKLTINLEREYAELLGRHFLNPGWETLFVAGAPQIIRFRLDESGAFLESEAAFIGENGGPAPVHRPRNLILNRPFLIYLREPDADQPYFAAWIENAELMLAAKPGTSE